MSGRDCGAWLIHVILGLTAAFVLFPARALSWPDSPATAQAAAAPGRADILRGAYGPHRANNDLLYYHLDVRVDPSALKC
jgi:hypothetical protein